MAHNAIRTSEAHTTKGRIIACINHGSIVRVLVHTQKGFLSILMEHRCFWNMSEEKADIKEKETVYDDETETLVFIEDLSN